MKLRNHKLEKVCLMCIRGFGQDYNKWKTVICMQTIIYAFQKKEKREGMTTANVIGITIF
jgi:hypothetical protein